MKTYEVEVEAIARGTVEVEAESEEEAMNQAAELGLERGDWFELSDATATRAKEVQI